MANFFETELISANGTPKLYEVAYPKVRFRMLDLFDEAEVNGEQIGYKTTFTNYMKRIHTLDPDLIVFPAYSAVPLGDAVRSFYQNAEQELPELDYVTANRALSNPKLLPKTREVVLTKETERLSSQYSGATAVVLDHYVCQGGTIDLAHDLLALAGITAKDIGLPAVRWYADIDEEERLEINLARLAHPRHSSFMKDVGRRAALRAAPQLTTSPQI